MIGKTSISLCNRAGKSADTRITVIQPSGKVLGDSEADPETMENHSDRPEFVKAMIRGNRRFHPVQPYPSGSHDVSGCSLAGR